MTDRLLDPFLLEGRTALVTGGTGGIGRACVRRLHDYGASVATTFLPETETAGTVGEAFPDLDRVTAHPLDLRDTASIDACLEAAEQAHGGIDILVNNAAVGSATVAAFSDDLRTQDTLMLAINADGTLKMSQGFLARESDPGHQGEPRKLINISSVGGGINVFPGFRVSDGMSKAAVAFMTKQLAAETVHSNVDVFAICPGATDTPMFDASTLAELTADERQAFEDGLPKGRLISPEEIASIVHVLATGLSQPLHGAVLDASMGLGVHPGMLG